MAFSEHAATIVKGWVSITIILLAGTGVMESTNYNIKYMIFSSSIIYTVKKIKSLSFCIAKEGPKASHPGL